MLALDEETVKGTPEVSMLLFSRRDSRRAAGALLEWLRERGGACSRSEMSGFSRKLETGELGFRFSRRNFYDGILRRFISLGLIALDLQYDEARRRPTKGYRIVLQPVTRHPPVSPSLPHLIHSVCLKWNEQFEAVSS